MIYYDLEMKIPFPFKYMFRGKGWGGGGAQSPPPPHKRKSQGMFKMNAKTHKPLLSPLQKKTFLEPLLNPIVAKYVQLYGSRKHTLVNSTIEFVYLFILFRKWKFIIIRLRSVSKLVKMLFTPMKI